MSLDSIKNQLPTFAKDVKLNLSAVLTQVELTPLQTWGTAIAVATALGDPVLCQALLHEAGGAVSSEQIDAAQGVAAVMGTNNVYYRFCHLAEDKDLLTMPARLRMNALRSSVVSQVDIELWSLAVSAVNGCGLCIESHYQKLREQNIGRSEIVAVVRIAAVLTSVAKLRSFSVGAG
jgi:lipoyl-dependent peroxiredoxin subunit D